VEGGALWTFNTDLSATWSGFADSGIGISGYYYDLADGGGTTAGVWTAETNGLATSPGDDAVHTVFVWSADAFGNIGTAVSDSIIALSMTGDYDNDGLSNTNEQPNGADPLDGDSDDDSMSDGWEVANGYSPTNTSDASEDTDSDGYNNRQEFYCDTHPSNNESRLIFENTVSLPGPELIVRWNSSTGRIYNLYYSDLPGALWQPLADNTNLPGTGGTMTFTGTVESVMYRLYKVGVHFP
jgi:hypothetical protein